jgi:Zn finger protein HypA/HybF involved in hydrogenase expression
VEIVKRKRTPASDEIAPETPVIPESLIEEAKRAIESDRMKKPAKCVVCGEETAPTSMEGLCWVCRRLKLSAWRDADSQMPMQE